ncbi:hypothetical protein ACHAXT_008877 [Thalassiosira profunda]
MSDLLPLVAAILKDKAALEASEEIATLRKERDASRRVEIIHAREGDIGEVEGEGDEVVVYASGRFEDGSYGRNANLWEVQLQSNEALGDECLLADLTGCQVCVGGGFPVANFTDPEMFQGWLHDTDEDDYEGPPPDGAVGMRFCFSPYSTWVTIWIRGWPKEEWEAEIRDGDMDPNESVRFLIDDVASQYPEAMVKFKEVGFVTRHIHGALKRLLSPRRKAKVRADRDARNEAADPQWDELTEFLMRTMRERGNEMGPETFMGQVSDVLTTLHRMGVHNTESGEERDAVVVQVVAWYEQFGADAMRDVVENALGQRNQGVGEEQDNTEPE